MWIVYDERAPRHNGEGRVRCIFARAGEYRGYGCRVWCSRRVSEEPMKNTEPIYSRALGCGHTTAPSCALYHASTRIQHRSQRLSFECFCIRHRRVGGSIHDDTYIRRRQSRAYWRRYCSRRNHTGCKSSDTSVLPDARRKLSDLIVFQLQKHYVQKQAH